MRFLHSAINTFATLFRLCYSDEPCVCASFPRAGSKEESPPLLSRVSRSSVLSQVAHAHQHLLLHGQIIAKASGPLYLRLSAKPCHLPLRIISMSLLRCVDALWLSHFISQ